MSKDDIAEVLAIEQSANDFPWSAKNFEDSLKAGHQAWVFFHSPDELLGYTLYQQIVDEVHLLNICIKPSFQGQGLGREILNYVIDFSTATSSVLILLEVRRSNQRAQQLYLQAGFNEMSVRKDYYQSESNREDAVLMGLTLMSFFNEC